MQVSGRGRKAQHLEGDAQLTHRQRARIADLNLLLDKVLDVETLTLQKELKRRGLLSQLQVRSRYRVAFHLAELGLTLH